MIAGVNPEMVTAKKTKTPAASAAAPRGRSEVQAAIVQAARALFAEKPYADVTTRAIAQAANVNLGLLHRHFGSKEAVVRGGTAEDADSADLIAAFSFFIGWKTTTAEVTPTA